MLQLYWNACSLYSSPHRSTYNIIVNKLTNITLLFLLCFNLELLIYLCSSLQVINDDMLHPLAMFALFSTITRLLPICSPSQLIILRGCAPSLILLLAPSSRLYQGVIDVKADELKARHLGLVSALSNIDASRLVEMHAQVAGCRAREKRVGLMSEETAKSVLSVVVSE